MKLGKALNGWNKENEKLYYELGIYERNLMDRAMLMELETTIPLKRRSFKVLYFLTLNRLPSIH